MIQNLMNNWGATVGDPPTARCDPLRIFTKKGEQPWTPKGAVARPDAIPLATVAQRGGCGARCGPLFLRRFLAREAPLP